MVMMMMGNNDWIWDDHHHCEDAGYEGGCGWGGRIMRSDIVVSCAK